MKTGFIFFAACFLFISRGSHAEDPKTYWILADVAPIWNKPKAQSIPVANLRTGTWFVSGKRLGDWIHIDSVYFHPLGGWEHASMVSEVKVDSSYLLKQMRLAKTFPDSVKWFERLVSLRPNNQHYMKVLQKGYIALGDTSRAAYIGRQIRGTNPIYLAHNDGKDILVIGFLDSAGEFTRLLWDEQPSGSEGKKFSPISKIDLAIKKKAIQLKEQLSTMVWYSICDRNRFPIPEKRTIALPRIVPPPGNFEGYYSHILDKTVFGISLGDFNDAFLNARVESSVFASSPIFPCRVPV